MTIPLRRRADTAELRAIVDEQARQIAVLTERLEDLERRVTPPRTGQHPNLAGVASWVKPRACASRLARS